MVQLTRPVKLRRTPFLSHLSLRASIIYKGAGPLASQQPLEAEPANPGAARGQTGGQTGGAALSGRRWCENRPPEGEATAESGRCRALYGFTPQREDQLPFREGDRRLRPARIQPARVRGGDLTVLLSFPGDLLDLHAKGESGWWYGGLNGKTGHFPSTYVEELLPSGRVQLADSGADSGQR